LTAGQFAGKSVKRGARKELSVKVKILEVSEDMLGVDKLLGYDATDWEEVDDKTYYDLCDWARRRNATTTLTTRVIVVCQSLTVTAAIQDYVKMMEEDKERERKRKVADKKRETTSARNKKEKKLKKLQELAKKHGIELPKDLTDADAGKLYSLLYFLVQLL
jgi:hypothetical protein